MNDKGEFNRLLSNWIAENAVCSFYHMTTKHRDYPRLLAYGKTAVPWVLERIRNGDYDPHMQVLLGHLSGTHPDYTPETVAPGWGGWKVEELAAAWLAWGKKNGYEAECT